MNYTVDQLKAILTEAHIVAYKAAEKHEAEYYPDNGWGACGFAWVNIWGIKGNTKLGRAMKAAGINKDYTGAYSIWNPSKYPTQNVSTLEAGAQAAAAVFKRYGFEKAYAGSRLD
tara:strand:+ start:378 stop:722 length:345 start_codon:yes stop_codon:yes gene_type:complete